LILGIVLVMAAVGFSLLYYDADVGFGAPAHPSFTGYKPAVLPNGIKVTGQSLTRQHFPGMDVWSFYYSLKLSSNDFAITESQKNISEPRTMSCQGYGGYCTLYHTPKGYTYRVWYNIYNNKPFALTVDWTEGNTDVDIDVHDSSAASYLPYNWNTVFDSMHPVNLSTMSYSKYTSCGCGG